MVHPSASSTPVSELIQRTKAMHAVDAADATKVYSDDHLADLQAWSFGGDSIQANWPSLTCLSADDDGWDWTSPESVRQCVEGDAYTCERFGSNSSAMWSYCESTCDHTLDHEIKEALAEGYTSKTWTDVVNTSKTMSWYVPCVWQGITNLRSVCASEFTPTVPTEASNNLGEKVSHANESIIYFNETNHGMADWDACNVHAFCYMCTEGDGTMNNYCGAILATYDSQHGTRTPSSVMSKPYYNQDFWCNATVLDAIDDGTYIDKLAEGSIKFFESDEVVAKQDAEVCC